jgi:LacI family transcriptional regulator
MTTARQVSVRQIAEQAGVSHATVSLALRGSPRLSAATRERVRSTAEAMGWRPNPAVAAWMAHRRSVSQPVRSEEIVFLNSWPDRAEWERSPWMTRYVDGARARAAELGYGFEEIYCPDVGSRLQSSLLARGVRGVLIGSLRADSVEPELDWSRYAAVGQSYSLARLNVARSLNNFYLSMRTAMAEMRALGYERIGYAHSAELERRTVHVNLSAYLGCQAELPPEQRLGLLDWSTADPRALREWIQRERPDALLSHDVEFEEILAKLGLRVPEDLGLAVLSLHPKSAATFPQFARLAGIDQRLERCGCVAVELLVARLLQNEEGSPDEPSMALTEGVWVPGATVRLVPKGSRRKPSRSPRARGPKTGS